MSDAALTDIPNLSKLLPALPPEETPKGLECLYSALLKLYPTQRNPLQVVARQKYWLNGLDPLDYVSMYFNPGTRDGRVAPHWHYVGMGLSDLHGDGRVHPTKDHTQPSGFGIELTFRLKCKDDEEHAPSWPANLLQQLARNAFAGRQLCVGDSVTWHVSLDGCMESRLRHILLADDAQLPTLATPLGFVNFVQIVGICDEELKASQRWNGRGVLELMRQNLHTGGELLITDLSRRSSLLELDFKAREAVDRGIATEGTVLSGLFAQCATWCEWNPALDQQKRPLATAAVSGQTMTLGNNADRGATTPVVYRGLEISLSFEAALMLPVMLQSRLAHDRHFTFSSSSGEKLTFVSPNVSNCLVSPRCPFASFNGWLQVFVGPDLHSVMMADLSELDEVEAGARLSIPRSYEWPNFRLKITIPLEQL